MKANVLLNLLNELRKSNKMLGLLSIYSIAFFATNLIYSIIQEQECFVCLFDLILYVPSTIFQFNREGSSWVEPVLS